MKVTINETEKKNLEFPRLMISKDGKILIIVVEIIDEDVKGVVVNNKGVVVDNNSLPIGYYSSSWKIDFFQDFKGSITLENE